MERSLKIKGTEDTPDIVFDPGRNEFIIKGRSLPEDASVFYAPVFTWLKEYLAEPHASAELNLNLDYFNSSSVKQILNLLSLFEEPANSGKVVRIRWCYSADDDLMEIKGNEFKSMLKVPFDMIAL
jgi:hypothetical protein